MHAQLPVHVVTVKVTVTQMLIVLENWFAFKEIQKLYLFQVATVVVMEILLTMIIALRP
jgi:hypothetical protein